MMSLRLRWSHFHRRDISMSVFEQSEKTLLPRPRTAPPRTRRAPHFHVIIWNDEEHSFDYVIDMLIHLFSYSEAQAYDIAWRVDHDGKAIAVTCHRELAELRREQIARYGPDLAIENAKRVSMRATIEEAPA
jgi:ATP-dependent Clp protease adaptor protein ClpS